MTSFAPERGRLSTKPGATSRSRIATEVTAGRDAEVPTDATWNPRGRVYGANVAAKAAFAGGRHTMGTHAQLA